MGAAVHRKMAASTHGAGRWNQNYRAAYPHGYLVHDELPIRVLLQQLKPKKSNVSGLPSPLRFRFCSANLPNSQSKLSQSFP